MYWLLLKNKTHMKRAAAVADMACFIYSRKEKYPCHIWSDYLKSPPPVLFCFIGHGSVVSYCFVSVAL